MSGNAQLLSPEQFLGYKVGTHYTPTYKVDDYFKAVAAAKPAMVKVESYGKTNEGRELMLAYIALPENLQRLEDIRKNNLRLSGTLQDGVVAQTGNAPAIVWLSYNVHGNETSSSEAAMLTLFALVDDNNTQTKKLAEKHGDYYGSLHQPRWQRPIHQLVQFGCWCIVQCRPAGTRTPRALAGRQKQTITTSI